MADIALDEFATPYIQVLTVSCRDNEFGLPDPRVRQALSLAINREAINSGLYQNFNEPWAAVLQGEWNDPNAPQFAYDPEKAKALLQEAGFDFDRELVLGFDYPDNLPRQLMEVIQANLQEIGVKATLLHAREAAAEETISNGRYTVWLDGYASHYSPFVIANVHRTTEQSTRGQCGSPALDALFEQAETIADPQGQKEIWSEIQTMVQEEASVIPLWRRGTKVAYHNRLQGWDNNTTASFAMFGFHAFGAEKWNVTG
jgi:peptide/nickel transport system substrate-binding protein